MTDLLAARKEDDRLREKVRLDEAPQHIELRWQVDNHVVLLEVARHLIDVLNILVPILRLLLALRASFSYRDVLRVVQRQTSEVLDGLGLGGGEEEGLAGTGQVGNDGIEGGGETHVENSVGFVEDCEGHVSYVLRKRRGEERTEDLEMVALETERLVHVLQQPSGSRDENVHPRQAVLLVLEVLASDD